MQLFYSPDITPPLHTLPEEESGHCVRVLRLAAGDRVNLTDGRGTLYDAVIEEAHPKHCTLRITGSTEHFEHRGYSLTVAVAPTKNIDRTEWFVEKAVEIGIDRIIPIECRHSERRTINGQRLEKIVVSAVKQSLKAYMPCVEPLTPVGKVLEMPFDGEKFIAHCEAGMPRRFLGDVLQKGGNALILIGPEGDFSQEEIEKARCNGFIEVTLGQSRLRTETAALTAVAFASLINTAK